MPDPRRLTPLLAALLLGTAAPALAQAQPGVTQRVDRLEREMRAVQRKVFPGSAQAPGYLEAEISAPAAPPANVGSAAAAPIADLTARVNSLEDALAKLTGQVEQNGFKLRQMEEQMTRFRSDAEYRLSALEGGAATPPADGAARPATRPTTTPPPRTTPTRTPTTDALEPAAPDAADAADAAPAEAPAADPSEEAYLAGYRLWTAKKYPEAEAALKDAVAKYPKARRASYAQNLLGRTYLDSGRPAAAAVAFHKNFTTNPRGERAPDSLYFLGQSLMKLDKPNPTKACEAYDALDREYGETIAADLKAKVAKGQADAKCKAG